MLKPGSYLGHLDGMPPELHKHARDHLIEVHAPNEAAVLKGIGEQQELTTQMRDHLLQSVSDLVDLKKADELMTAAQVELAD